MALEAQELVSVTRADIADTLGVFLEASRTFERRIGIVLTKHSQVC